MGNSEVRANLSGKIIIHFRVARNSRSITCKRVAVNRVPRTFPYKKASVVQNMAHE
jgi:hypothetical protein